MQPSDEKSALDDPRLRLAGERTMLAWIRTGIALMGFGFIVARFGVFLREIAPSAPAGPNCSTSLSLWIGAGLIVLGIAVNTLSAIRHRMFLRGLDAGRPYQPDRWSLAVVVAFALAIAGIGMVVYLLSLPNNLGE